MINRPKLLSYIPCAVQISIYPVGGMEKRDLIQALVPQPPKYLQSIVKHSLQLNLPSGVL